jgi:DNA polymerase family A
MPTGCVVFDLETANKDLFWRLPPEEFVRLCGYKYWDEDEVHITTDLNEMRQVLLHAKGIIAHNCHQFDLPALFGVKSNIPLKLAMHKRVIDTMTHAILANPAPLEYNSWKDGQPKKTGGPESQMPWFSLNQQAYSLGVLGKTDDITELATKWAPEYEEEGSNGRTLIKKDVDAGYGLIPLDDPEYRAYLEGDIRSSQEVARAILKKKPMDAYDWRQQEVAARIFVIRSNGFKVDVPVAETRVATLEAQKDELMKVLVEKYDFPTEGNSPWDTDTGKRATLAILADVGITPAKLKGQWPKTDGWKNRDKALAKELAKADALDVKVAQWEAEKLVEGTKERRLATLDRWILRDATKAKEIRDEPLPPYYGHSLSGDTMVELTAGTEAEETGKMLALLKGQRSLAQSALDCMQPDGFVHPDITALQKSGRWSTTKPGLTIWDASGPEKQYWIADSDEEAIVGFDLEAADARGVAALSGDEKYAERFEPGMDSHLINAWVAWGKDVVGDERDEDGRPIGETARYRQLAKPGGHGWGYRIGAVKLAGTWKLPVTEAKAFLTAMSTAFKKVVGWQDRMVRVAVQAGYVTNPWGRKMKVDRGREFTQAPALMGQSFTTEVIVDAVLALDIWALRKIKVAVHDALVFSIPRKDAERWSEYIISKMEQTYVPKDDVGLTIEMPAVAGKLGDNWDATGH